MRKKRILNKEQHAKYVIANKRWRENNKEYLKAYNLEYRSNNKEKIAKQKKDKKLEDLEAFSRSRRQYYQDNKAHMQEMDKKRYYRNFKRRRETRNKQSRELRAKRKKEKKPSSEAIRCKYDYAYLLYRRLYKSAYGGLRKLGLTVPNNVMVLIGCTRVQFKEYFESKFTDDMSWTRINEIHIDHIRPVISFDLRDIMQLKACFHYTNLQPLWAKDNILKGTIWNNKRIQTKRETIRR